jgi:uncharacterized protein YidB (DUF937 family)
MGLFDSVIGAIAQAQGGQAQGALPGAGAHPDLLNAVAGLIGQHGGLAGLVDKFHQGGLGDIVNSWIGTGHNLPVSADQVTQVLGDSGLAQIAQRLGLNHGDVAGQLSQMLPQLVDKLTPNGQLPPAGAGGPGGLGDLAGMLGGLFNR